MEQNQWGPRTEDLALSLSASPSANRLGRPIAVRMLLKNFGSQPATLVITTPWADYEFSVRDENDREVPETAYATRAKASAEEGRRATRELPPGAIADDTLEFDRMFELKTAGLYRVVASRRVFCPTPGRFVIVTSNSLALKMTP